MNPYDAFKQRLKRDHDARAAKTKATYTTTSNPAYADLLDSIHKWQATHDQFMGSQFTQPRKPYQPPTPGWCKVLGLPPGASQDQIKSAYRKLAMKHHPDKGGDAATFNNLTKAYKEATK